MYQLLRNQLSKARFYFTATAAATTTSRNILERLPNRKIIKVTGFNVYDYLQGLVTNDVKHLELGSGSMYTMFLNTKGRVVFDTIIYKCTQQADTLLIDCDANLVESLERHLKMYRVRRKIDISVGKYDVYALFDPSHVRNIETETSLDTTPGAIFPCDKLTATMPAKVTSSKKFIDLLIYKDPRMSQLGSRVLAPSGCDYVRESLSEIVKVETVKTHETHRWVRYNLGVGEGAKDILTDNAFPLEANCDYLHGVSFHKGCYIGQELTARTHHTGVVRKRLMPIYFSKTPSELPEKVAISNESGFQLGKIRGIEGNVGLGLLRIANVLDLKEFAVGDGVGRTRRPSWWPMEVAKEKISSQKN